MEVNYCHYGTYYWRESNGPWIPFKMLDLTLDTEDGSTAPFTSTFLELECSQS